LKNKEQDALLVGGAEKAKGMGQIAGVSSWLFFKTGTLVFAAVSDLPSL